MAKEEKGKGKKKTKNDLIPFLGEEKSAFAHKKISKRARFFFSFFFFFFFFLALLAVAVRCVLGFCECASTMSVRAELLWGVGG